MPQLCHWTVMFNEFPMEATCLNVFLTLLIVPFWSRYLSHTTHMRSHTKFQLIWAINTAFSRGGHRGHNVPPPSVKCEAGTPSVLGLSLVRPTMAVFEWIPSNCWIFHHSSSFLITLGPSSSASSAFVITVGCSLLRRHL